MVHQLVRDISKKNYTNPETGEVSIAFVDENLNEWYAKGYKLFNTHYLGEIPEAFKVLYILVKE